MTEREREQLAALAMGDLTQAEAEYLLPSAGKQLAGIEAAIAALQAEGASPPRLPRGLAAATVARQPVTHPARFAWSGRRRLADKLAPVASIAAGLFVAVTATGLLASAVQKVREESRVIACRNSLRELHFALDGYAQTHAQRYPEVGTSGLPVAGELAAELVRAGQPVAAVCPSGGPYAYTLGYRGEPGRLFGTRRGESDLAPVAADASGQTHGAGRNVLFASGAVLYATTPTLGPGGDDIFSNQLGKSRAGLHRADVSLGGPADYP